MLNFKKKNRETGILNVAELLFKMACTKSLHRTDIFTVAFLPVLYLYAFFSICAAFDFLPTHREVFNSQNLQQKLTN